MASLIVKDTSCNCYVLAGPHFVPWVGLGKRGVVPQPGKANHGRPQPAIH